MSQNVNPPWLREESYEPLKTSNTENGIPQSTTANSGIDPRRSNLIFWVLKVVTMILCLLMMATAGLGLYSIGDVEAVGRIFIATYMLFFSVLLFTFELMEWRRVEWLDHLLRRNFGFLYGAMGKAFFIIFIAFLSFGLGDPVVLTMVTGTALAAFGVLEVALYLKYPELFEPENK